MLVALGFLMVATFMYLVLGVLSIGLVALFGGQLTAFMNAPLAAAFVPGMALSVFIRRLGAMPERILTMQMNFRPSGMALGLGELAFTATAARPGCGCWSRSAPPALPCGTNCSASSAFSAR